MLGTGSTIKPALARERAEAERDDMGRLKSDRGATDGQMERRAKSSSRSPDAADPSGLERIIGRLQKGQELAALASMMISGMEGFNIGMEYSPEALRGLSHREIGDNTQAISLLLETPEPFLDATRGRTDQALLLEGKDDYVVRAGKHGLLFEQIDESGWPIDIRVGRNTSSILQILELWSAEQTERAILLSGIPRYGEVVDKGTGFFLKNPKKAAPSRVVYE